jgi:hypothetical protein
MIRNLVPTCEQYSKLLRADFACDCPIRLTKVPANAGLAVTVLGLWRMQFGLESSFALASNAVASPAVSLWPTENCLVLSVFMMWKKHLPDLACAA